MPYRTPSGNRDHLHLLQRHPRHEQFAPRQIDILLKRIEAVEKDKGRLS